MDNRTLEEVRKNEDRLINELEQLQQENQKYKEVIDNIKYYLEDSANQMSEEASYTLMSFLKEV